MKDEPLSLDVLNEKVEDWVSEINKILIHHFQASRVQRFEEEKQYLLPLPQTKSLDDWKRFSELLQFSFQFIYLPCFKEPLCEIQTGKVVSCVSRHANLIHPRVHGSDH